MRQPAGRWCLALLATWTLSACHNVEVVPAVPVDGPLVLFVELASADGPRVFVGRIDDNERAWPVFSARAEGGLYALSYPCSAETLNLRIGWQALLDQAPRGFTLPLPETIYRLRGTDEASYRWDEAAFDDELRNALQRLPVPDFNLCDALAPEYSGNPLRITLDDVDELLIPTGAIPQGESVLLTHLRSRGNIRVGTGTVGPLVSLFTDGVVARRPELETRGAILAALERDDGRWLAVTPEELLEGEVGVGLFPLASVTSGPTEQVALDGPSSGSIEAFWVAERLTRALGLTDVALERTLYHYDGSSVAQIAQVEVRESITGSRAYVAWTGPGEALVVGMTEEPGLALRATRAEIFEEPVIAENPRELRFLRRLKDGRIVAAARSGALYLRAGGPLGAPSTWEKLPQITEATIFQAIAGDRDALVLLVSASGLGVASWTPRLGQCPARNVSDRPTDVQAVTPSGRIWTFWRSTHPGSIGFTEVIPQRPEQPSCGPLPTF